MVERVKAWHDENMRLSMERGVARRICYCPHQCAGKCRPVNWKLQPIRVTRIYRTARMSKIEQNRARSSKIEQDRAYYNIYILDGQSKER